MKARLSKELKWLVGCFLAPMLVFIGLDLALSQSSLPLSERLLTLEDTCSYGICFILPALLYVVALSVRAFIAGYRRASRGRAPQSFEQKPPSSGGTA